MTPQLLREVGEALYGERWQSPLARDLGVAERSLRRWLSGERSLPDGLEADLRKLLIARGKAVAALARQTLLLRRDA